MPDSSGSAISCTAVTPWVAATPAPSSCSSSMRWTVRAEATHSPTCRFASRVTSPVGRPLVSRSTPGVSRASANVSAAEFTSATCPSVRRMTSGSLVTASSSASVGRVGSPHRRLVVALQRDHIAPCRRRRAPRRSRAALDGEPAAATSSLAVAAPTLVRCTCASMKPGRMVHPGSSTTRSAAGRIAGADPLDVTAVDQHPLPQRGMPEGVDACGAEQGLHDVRMMPRRMRPAREGAPMAAIPSSVPGAKVRRFASFSRSPTSSQRARPRHRGASHRIAIAREDHIVDPPDRGDAGSPRPLVRDGQDRLAHPGGRRGTDRDAPNAGVSKTRELCDQRLGLAARPPGGHPDRGGTDRRVARGHVAHDDQARPRALGCHGAPPREPRRSPRSPGSGGRPERPGPDLEVREGQADGGRIGASLLWIEPREPPPAARGRRPSLESHPSPLGSPEGGKVSA